MTTVRQAAISLQTVPDASRGHGRRAVGRSRSPVTAAAIAALQQARHNAGLANRTINMDVGVLSRVLKFHGLRRQRRDASK